MTTVSSNMPNDFMNSDLCLDISTIPGNNFNIEGIPEIQDVENLEDPLKNNVSVIQTQVNLPVNNNLECTNDDRFSNVYVTLPTGPLIKCSVNYVCRLCANAIDINLAVNIFSSDSLQENLAYKINKYLPIVVYEADPFPKTICKPCVTKINEFHDLAEKCVTVEEQLRQTCAFDGRFVDELHKNINQKPGLEVLKYETENDWQLYTGNEFHYTENLDMNQVNSNLNSKEGKLEKVADQIKPGGRLETVDQFEKINDVKEDLICQCCEGSVSDMNDCFDHLDRHFSNTPVDQMSCLFCDYINGSVPDLKKHLKTHFKKIESSDANNAREKTKARQQKILKNKIKACTKLLSCKKCKETLDGIDVAVEHCIQHKPGNMKFYPCILCLDRIAKCKLKDHVTMHYPTIIKPILTCDNCYNLYPDEKTLKYHRCTKLRKYKCSQCNQGFRSEDRLKFHEDFHRNKSTFCDICKKDFKFESRMYLHFSGVHNGIREKPYCCDVCGKTFTWLTLLNSHKRTHTNERPFKCTKCDARFCNKYSLSGHMPSHEDHPQMYCDKCDYHTGRKQNLRNHMSRFHKEISTSQVCIRCKICNEIFPNRHHVVVEGHSSRHSETEINSLLMYATCDSDLFQEFTVTKLYQCERCERCFASLDHLNEHRTRHSSCNSNSFYQCRLCDNTFTKHDLLVKHQKIHVQITSQYTSKLSVLIVITCDICGMECIDYRQLLNHKDRANCMVKKVTGTLQPRKVLIKKHLQPLKAHQLYVNSNGLFECQTCQRTYKNRRRYRLHLATHSNTVF